MIPAPGEEGGELAKGPVLLRMYSTRKARRGRPPPRPADRVRGGWRVPKRARSRLPKKKGFTGQLPPGMKRRSPDRIPHVPAPAPGHQTRRPPGRFPPRPPPPLASGDPVAAPLPLSGGRSPSAFSMWAAICSRVYHVHLHGPQAHPRLLLDPQDGPHGQERVPTDVQEVVVGSPTDPIQQVPQIDATARWIGVSGAT